MTKKFYKIVPSAPQRVWWDSLVSSFERNDVISAGFKI